MKKHLLTLLFSLTVVLAVAGPGDTTKIRSHDRVHMNAYGTFDRKAKFPDMSKSYNRILMRYTLGCPDNGCSAWDYTTQVFLRQHTGLLDSTERKAPNFTVDNASRDSLRYSNDTTYTYFFNAATQMLDSASRTSLTLVKYENAATPLEATDTLTVWEAGYYRPEYDGTGTLLDSVFLGFDAVIYKAEYTYYETYERIHNIELGRVITPYAGDRTKTWSYTYTFDVTDYRTLLADSAEIRAFYSGYQDGFTITLDFDFIEGTPARECYQVIPLWEGSFPYGDPNNSIENYLNERSVTVDAGADAAVLRVIQTGHGFGGNENCAEFCPKTQYVSLNRAPLGNRLVWKDDCGLNPIYPQTGTWIYDRANWCPGSQVKPFDYDLSARMTKGAENTVNLDMEPFTNINNNFCSYTISGVVFLYKANVHATDVSMEEILAPSSKANHVRFNPICGYPLVRVKNNGTTEVTSIKLNYGVMNGPQNSYTWRGSLQPQQEQQITLANDVNWIGAESKKFEVTISEVNGAADAYLLNNTERSEFALPDQLPEKFIVLFRSNLRGSDNSYTIKDFHGNVVVSKGNFASSKTHYDTITLPSGCYTFEFLDASANGLSFFANNDGSGVLSIRSTSGQMLKSFNPDFGTSVVYHFTAQYKLGVTPVSVEKNMTLYPNPAGNTLYISFAAPPASCQLQVLDISGKIFSQTEVTVSADNTVQLNTSALPPGIYLVKVLGAEGYSTQKFIKMN